MYYHRNIQLNNNQVYNAIKKQTITKYKKNVLANFKTKKNLKIKLFLKKNLESLKTKSILKNFFECISKFTSKKFKIFLTLQKLNENIKLNKNTKKILKKKLIKLRKYKESLFFRYGIKTIFTVVTSLNSSKLFAQFIAIQLKYIKRHNFFFKFLKDLLSLFKNKIFSKSKGIKIKIKGRLNGRSRTRSKVLKIANSVPLLTIKSTINYSEATAYTLNGTFGVKV
jgi:ribosomal protein S3